MISFMMANIPLDQDIGQRKEAALVAKMDKDDTHDLTSWGLYQLLRDPEIFPTPGVHVACRNIGSQRLDLGGNGLRDGKLVKLVGTPGSAGPFVTLLVPPQLPRSRDQLASKLQRLGVANILMDARKGSFVQLKTGQRARIIERTGVSKFKVEYSDKPGGPGKISTVILSSIFCSDGGSDAASSAQ